MSSWVVVGRKVEGESVSERFRVTTRRRARDSCASMTFQRRSCLYALLWCLTAVDAFETLLLVCMRPYSYDRALSAMDVLSTIMPVLRCHRCPQASPDIKRL